MPRFDRVIKARNFRELGANTHLGAEQSFLDAPVSDACDGRDGAPSTLAAEGMALAGLRSIAEITPDLVRRLGPEPPFGRNAS